MTPRTWPKQFRAAASTFDWPALAQLAAEYATHLYTVPNLPDGVGQVLLALRQSQRYEELELVVQPQAREDEGIALVGAGEQWDVCRIHRAHQHEAALERRALCDGVFHARLRAAGPHDPLQRRSARTAVRRLRS